MTVRKSTRKVTSDYVNYSIANFSDFLTNVVSKMNNNENFPTLQTQVSALATGATNFYALKAAAAEGGKTAKIARNTARIEITNQLHVLGTALNSICNGNLEMLSTTGMPLNKVPQNSTPLEKPASPLLNSGINSGVINCKTNPQDGMKSATYYITTDATALTEGNVTGWQSFPFGESTFSFTNLVPGQRYYIKVGHVGVRKQNVMSEPVSFIAQ